MNALAGNQMLRAAFIVLLAVVADGPASAQTFTVLHSFSGSNGITPQAGLVVSGGVLYGTALQGGAPSQGTVFRVGTDGTGFTTLHTFEPTSGGGAFGNPPPTNYSGSSPRSELVLADGILYGTTRFGGTAGYGTIFKINTNGSGFTILHNFVGAGEPRAGLLVSGNRLYGAAQGTSSAFLLSYGTIFALNTDGTGFTNLHTFSGPDGAAPSGTLLLADNVLYGTTYANGSYARGTIFKMNTDGSGFATLHHFTGTSGAQAFAGLTLSGEFLYGTTVYGGLVYQGNVFAIKTNGSGFRNLRYLQGSDGTEPKAGLLLRGNALYGSTCSGGASSQGTIYSINTDGTGFSVLHHFTSLYLGTNWDGAAPYTFLVASENALYGTTQYGGSGGGGVVFKLSLPAPGLKINSAGANVVLAWPADTGFNLEFSSNAVAGDWNAVPSSPVTFQGQSFVTNPASGAHVFFRLRR